MGSSLAGEEGNRPEDRERNHDEDDLLVMGIKDTIEERLERMLRA